MKRCKVWKLKQAETKATFSERVQERAALIRKEPGDVEKVWKDLKDCFLEEAVDVCGETRGIARQNETWWWNEEVAALVVALAESVETITVAGSPIKLQSSIKSLGVYLDSHMSFDKHVSEICKASYFHIRALRHIRSSLTTEAAKMVAVAIVGSRLDYCNSLLAGTSESNLARLQMVQNTLARVVAQKSRYCHITPVLAGLHWLPVRHRIDFKIATTAFKVLHHQQPSYLAQILPRYIPPRSLRSSSSITISAPFRKTSMATSKSFSSTASRVWNKLPTHVSSALTLPVFRRHLKHHYFLDAYPGFTAPIKIKGTMPST